MNIFVILPNMGKAGCTNNSYSAPRLLPPLTPPLVTYKKLSERARPKSWNRCPLGGTKGLVLRYRNMYPTYLIQNGQQHALARNESAVFCYNIPGTFYFMFLGCMAPLFSLSLSRVLVLFFVVAICPIWSRSDRSFPTS